jgi:hypothetical protein
VLSLVAPDGFPFSIRVPMTVDASNRLIRIDAEPVGAPLAPGLACIAAHDHDERFTYQRNFQIRGDLIRQENGWALQPHKLVGGFELPPGSLLERLRINYAKSKRFRKTAKREFARRAR